MTLQLNFSHEPGPTNRNGLPPVVILHGLFGSSRNWTSVATALAKLTEVYSIDQRNHGDSPHADTHTLADLREDLRAWLEQHNVARPIVIGHSMGGMAAMAFALRYPEALSGLVVVDIAPRRYPPHHTQEFAGLSLDVSQCASRADVDAQMKPIVPDPTVRQFLQMNLARRPDNQGYYWKINVPALKAATHTDGLESAGDHASGESNQTTNANTNSSSSTYSGPTLFVRGGTSDYIRPEDTATIENFFPRAQIHTIEGHGHWLHYTAMQEFLASVEKFLRTTVK